MSKFKNLTEKNMKFLLKRMREETTDTEYDEINKLS